MSLRHSQFFRLLLLCLLPLHSSGIDESYFSQFSSTSLIVASLSTSSLFSASAMLFSTVLPTTSFSRALDKSITVYQLATCNVIAAHIGYMGHTSRDSLSIDFYHPSSPQFKCHLLQRPALHLVVRTSETRCTRQSLANNIVPLPRALLRTPDFTACWRE